MCKIQEERKRKREARNTRELREAYRLSEEECRQLRVEELVARREEERARREEERAYKTRLLQSQRCKASWFTTRDAFYSLEYQEAEEFDGLCRELNGLRESKLRRKEDLGTMVRQSLNRMNETAKLNTGSDIQVVATNTNNNNNKKTTTQIGQ